MNAAKPSPESIVDSLGACMDARRWLRSYTDAQKAWDECDRPDWMLWLLGRAKPDHRKLVSCLCCLVRLALPLVPADERLPLQLVEKAEAWGDGKGIVDDLAEARHRLCVLASQAPHLRLVCRVGWAAYDVAVLAVELSTIDGVKSVYRDQLLHEISDVACAIAPLLNRDIDNAYFESQACADVIREFFPNPPSGFTAG